MKTNFVKKVVIALVLTSLHFVLGAQPADNDEALQQALQNQDMVTIQSLLESCSPESREQVESIILDSARAAILSQNFDFSSKLSEMVLLHNLDNIRAQDLYTAVEDAKRQEQALQERRQQEEQALQERKKQEEEAAAKKAAEEQERQLAAEKARLEVEEAEKARIIAQKEAAKWEEEKARQKAEEEAFLKEVRVISLKNFSFLFDISPLSFDFSGSQMADSFTGTKKTNIRYGLGAQFQVKFDHPYVFAKLGASTLFSPVLITGTDTKFQVSSRVAIGSPKITGPFALGVGYYYYKHPAFGEQESQSLLFTQVGSPTIGLGFEDWRIFNLLDISLAADWLVVSALDPFMDFAFKAEFNIRYPVINLRENISLYLASDNRYCCFISKPGVEWSFDTTVSVGVILHEKTK